MYLFFFYFIPIVIDVSKLFVSARGNVAPVSLTKNKPMHISYKAHIVS